MKPVGQEVAEMKANKAADDVAVSKIDMSKVKVEPLFWRYGRLWYFLKIWL